MGFLSRLGLISQVQPAEPATDWEAKYKAAITDLAGATDTIGDFKIAFDRMEKDRDNWRDQALRDAPDAEKWRDRAARELQRGQAKRDGAAKGRGK